MRNERRTLIRRISTILRTCVLLMCSMFLGACSLLSFESPAKPLPARDLNARIQTREFARTFASTVTGTADRIASSSTDPEIRLAALRWKINATAACRGAVTQVAPLTALLDTWALTSQMREFVSTGAGATLFGDQQGLAITAATDLDSRMESIVRSLTSSEEFARYQGFVNRYRQDYPLADLKFERASVLEIQSREAADAASLITTVGTAPEVMSDIADRMRLFGEQVPESMRWQMQLAMRESGYGESDIREVMKRLDAHLDRLASVAESSPELVHASIADMRTALHETIDDLEGSWSMMMQSVRAEREALAGNILAERAALTESFDGQRREVTRDAQRIVSEFTETSWQHIHRLTREILLLATLAIVAVLGASFAGGFVVGRAAMRR